MRSIRSSPGFAIRPDACGAVEGNDRGACRRQRRSRGKVGRDVNRLSAVAFLNPDDGERGIQPNGCYVLGAIDAQAGGSASRHRAGDAPNGVGIFKGIAGRGLARHHQFAPQFLQDV